MTKFRRLSLAAALLATIAMPAFAQGSAVGGAATPAAQSTTKAHIVRPTVHKTAAMTKTTEVKTPIKPAPTAKSAVTAESAQPTAKTPVTKSN